MVQSLLPLREPRQPEPIHPPLAYYYFKRQVEK